MAGMDAPTLRVGARTLSFDGVPMIMGILNATPDSFSDAGELVTLDQQTARADLLLSEGAEILDVGGQSARTDRAEISIDEEIERVVPLIETVVERHPEAVISIDTYRPAVAEAAITAGARIVNDISGLADLEIADVCARTGAALVIMHTRAAPKQKVLDYPYDDVVEDMISFFTERVEAAAKRGVALDQITLDPGPDFGKSPSQTVEALRGIPRLQSFGRPILLCVSRKDFIGAVTHRAPRARLAGTLAAVAAGVDAGAQIVRVHDVAEVREYLTVRGVLRGELELHADARLSDEIRWDSGARL